MSLAGDEKGAAPRAVAAPATPSSTHEAPPLLDDALAEGLDARCVPDEPPTIVVEAVASAFDATALAAARTASPVARPAKVNPQTMRARCASRQHAPAPGHRAVADHAPNGHAWAAPHLGGAPWSLPAVARRIRAAMEG